MLRLGFCKPPSLLPAALLDSAIRGHLGCLEGWQRSRRQILTHPLLFVPAEPKCCPATEDGSDYRKGDPFQSPRVGSCLTLRNELSEETHVLTKQEILLGKGTQENCSAVSGFMVMGLVSGWSLANHSTSESFLVVHASLSQDGCW